MAVSDSGIISEPVNLPWDINKALGVSSGDLGTLCKSTNINKWAMYKPEALTPKDYLTLAERKANYFGLTPYQNGKAQAVAYGYGGTAHDIGDSGYSISDIVAANQEWAYRRPSGNASSPYRQTDFACDRARTYGIQGYRHDARPPLFGWSDWELFLSDVNSIINASIVGTIYNRDTDPFAWKVDNILYDGTFYNSLSGRLSENSASRFGGGGSDQIPISWLLGGITTENWRIAIGVFIEGESKMLMFTSSYPLRYLTNTSTVMQQGPVFPALGTNQFLCKKMVAALGNSATKTFTAIPLLIKNCIQTVGQLDGGQQTLVAFSGTNSIVYSPPSDSVAFTITLRNEQKPTVQGLTVVDNSGTTDGKFVLGIYGTGQYAGSGSSASITPVLALGIFLADGQSFTGTKTLVYDVDYTYGLNGQVRNTGHISGSISITNSNIVTVNGQDYVGMMLTAAPSLTVTTFTRLTYQT